MKTLSGTSNTANKLASRPAKTGIALTNLPLRVNLVKHGSFGDDFSKKRGNWLVETDFHRTGEIKNGPEAHIAELDSDDEASGINGFDYKIGHARAKILAQIFAGSPALFRAAKHVNEATSREPKFKHSETYQALTELMAAVEAIENGSLIFQPLA